MVVHGGRAKHATPLAGAAPPLPPRGSALPPRRPGAPCHAGVAAQAEAGQYKGEDNIFPTVHGKESAAAKPDAIQFNMTVRAALR